MQASKHEPLICLLKPSTANTTVNSLSAEIDMSGYEGIRAIGICGNTTGDALFTLYISGSTATGGSFTTLTGASVVTTTGLADGLLAITCHRPQTRFLKVGLHRNGANGAHGGIVAYRYGASKIPVSNDSTSMLVAEVNVVGTT